MTPSATQHRSAVSRFFRNPETGEVVVGQRPNAPLLMWLVATLVRLVFSPHGVVGTTVSVVGTVSLIVWSLLEIARGDSPFRRVVGGLVLAAIVVRLVL